MHDQRKAAAEEYAGEQFKSAIQERSKHLNTKEGESLSIDEIQDIFIQVKGKERERVKMSLNTRTKTGDINDYLDTRRPFGATSQQ